MAETIDVRSLKEGEEQIRRENGWEFCDNGMGSYELRIYAEVNFTGGPAKSKSNRY